VVEGAALIHLTQAFVALMPPVADPQLPLHVAVDPVSIAPAGVGGVIGLSRAPIGEIHARRVHAVARVRVGTTDADALDAAVTSVTAAVIAGDRAHQRAAGLLEADLQDVGPQTTITDAGQSRHTRDVSFRLLFEHIELPTEGEEVITSIPLVSRAPSGPNPGFRITSE
jgi:hypothetical protein